jgi:anti-sigma-K factor RskA
VNDQLTIEALWDAYRDGDISAADKARFEQYLAQHPDQQALFEAESQWLEALHDEPVLQANAMPVASAMQQANRAFANAVLDQWDADSRPVLARIHWKSAAFSAGWLVAAAAIAIAMWFNAPEATIPDNNSTQVALEDGPRPGARDRRHPLTSLVQDMDQTYEEQPTNVFAAFGSMMNLSNVEFTPVNQASYQER